MLVTVTKQCMNCCLVQLTWLNIPVNNVSNMLGLDELL